MSDEKKRVPKLRFPGFTEEWEQRKLGEIADKVTEKNKNNDFSEPFTNSAEQGIISQKDYFDREIVNNENLNGYYIVRKNDFIYNPRISVSAPVGPINRNRLGRNGVMSPLYTVFRTHDIDNLYLGFYFKTTSWHRFMKLNGDSGARFDRFTISSTEFMKMPIPYPEIEEQKKIGEYFDQLDNLITLHQCRLKHWEEMKKGLLQQMFPKKGETCPQIRFPEFNDDWEQRKLRDEAIEMLAGGDIDKSKIVENGKYPIYAYALTNDGIVGYYDDYYRVKAPAVTVTGRGDVGHAQARTVDFTPVVRLLTIRSEHDAYFLENAINNHGVVVESTGVPQLTVPQLGNYMIQFPRTIEEETKIGEYFRNLDNLITLHQRKLEHLQKLKKGLLQQMFI